MYTLGHVQQYSYFKVKTNKPTRIILSKCFKLLKLFKTICTLINA